ncbi:MAG: PD-(D/E)XK nuclease family protein, partial [Acidobacteria bacterium]|nr:PD-(D/E)XK nuclease family protein [Acidobacteriota bacterium]
MGEVRRLLDAGARDFRLLVPTATMAEHLRNQLAREGFAFPPELVSTLTRFLAGYSKGLEQAPPAALPLIVETTLSRRAPAAFAKVAGFAGFSTYLARLIEDFASVGCGVERLSGLAGRLGLASPIVSGFLEIFRAAEAELRKRGWLLRGELLSRLASRIQSGSVPGCARVFFDGFLSMTDPELEVVGALAAHAEVTVTLPCWSGADAARESLLKIGFREEPLTVRRRARPAEIIVEARSQAEEVDEIARRILAEHSTGRPWREMGVILRGAETYAPALRSSFERFGVPARFLFAQPAAEHELIRFLTGVVEAALGGWDHEALLGPLSMAVSGRDGRFEFHLRERLPARGLDGLRTLGSINALERLDAWLGERRMPAEWARRAVSLRSLLTLAAPAEPFTHETALLARSTAAAWDAFEAAVGEAAEWMDAETAVPFADFWHSAAAALRMASLRVADGRRDVVHVIDVYEARQWELPVAFVCGLLEKEFPRYHSQDAVFDDDARRLLAGAGVRVRTSEERQEEERFLFDIATSRATSALVLSAPRSNDKGDENLRSFFLDEFARRPGIRTEPARPARPAARNPARLLAPSPILDGELRAWTARKHSTLAPTSIESFLQCPFQFFARKTLEVGPAPGQPEDRLDIPLQGRILHEALADLARNPREDPLTVLARVFERYCAKERIPQGYRREAVHLELERNLLLFAGQTALPKGWKTEVEQSFELELDDIRIRGRIDRVDIDPKTGRTMVIDYKYSSPQTVRNNVKAHEEGRLVQGGLYLLAAEKRF